MERRAFNFLLVDDDFDDMELTQEALKRATLPIQLHPVDNGKTALAFLRKEGAFAGAPDPDLVLLDLNMPVMDGREFLRLLRADPRLRAIPALVITTSASEEDVVACYALGANGFITKPARLEEFYEVIAAIENFWLTVAKLPRTIRSLRR